jgi:nucleoid-associated protein YgaU
MAFAKAQIQNLTTKTTVDVLFNPEEYTINRDINFAQNAIPGLSGPLLQFVNGNMQTLEMELFLDTYENNPGNADVRIEVKKITDLMNIEPSNHAPPILNFKWGSLSFTCVLARASQRYIMFNTDGVPVRARVQVTFNEFLNAELEAKEVKRETADYTKIHTVIEGENLSMIAGQVYSNPKLWRPIALVNQIINPRKLTAGNQLIIPRLPYENKVTGDVYQ